jgi:hypothetical protein
MRVALLPTGRTEWRGLPGALRRLFPGDSNLEFFVLPTASEVLSNPDGFPYPGFTSNALTVADEVSPPESAMELVGRAAQAALGDRHVEPADLVVVLDDLELANAGQADRVCRVFRAAVTQHLAKLGSGAVEARTRSALVQRVSFHLLVPMVEALFFADEGALRAAGVPEGRHVEFTSERDPEAFVTADPEYRLATADDCPCWHQLPQERRQQVLRKKKLRPKWIEGRRMSPRTSAPTSCILARASTPCSVSRCLTRGSGSSRTSRRTGCRCRSASGWPGTTRSATASTRSS